MYICNLVLDLYMPIVQNEKSLFTENTISETLPQVYSHQFGSVPGFSDQENNTTTLFEAISVHCEFNSTCGDTYSFDGELDQFEIKLNSRINYTVCLGFEPMTLESVFYHLYILVPLTE